jgi:CRISPR-associated protein Csd1
MVFGPLCANAQNHLRKARNEKPGAYVVLDKLFTEIMHQLGAAPPPVQFSLQEQGRFALGYYHQRARRFEEIAERKLKAAAEKAEAAAL